MIDLNSIKKIYFVGIGGIAMSAVANIARSFNYEVTGSDGKEVYAPAKDVLDKFKISYFVGYNAEHVKQSKADLYILSAGEDMKNPEVEYIVNNNLARAGFAELLYEISKDKLRVVVAGTHGKSTTTGLLGHLLKNLDDSSFVAGAVLQNYNSNFYKGDGHYFVFEGDEYKSEFDDPTPKFQYYKPDILVLTNLEYDHPDLFESLEALETEFEELIDKMPEDGLIIYNADNAALTKLVHKSNISSVSYGIDNEADLQVENIQYGEYTKIEVRNKFSKDKTAAILGLSENYQTQLPGKINVYNALAVIATLRCLGFGPDQIALDLLSYKGVKRRFEILGQKNGITIIDDYAHHPTAVRETLEAARQRYFPMILSPQARGDVASASERQRGRTNVVGKLWAIFEPHTFSRTKATLPDLVKSFDAADEVLISEIYPAREKASEATIKSEGVAQAIGLHQKHVRLVHDKQEALSILKSEARPGDVVVIMAVGSFNRLAYELKEIL